MDDSPTAAPTSDTVIAIARDYDGLLAALKQRTAELNVTMEVLDEISGMPARYVSKIFAPVPIKNIGAISLGALLGALGLKLAVMVDQEQFDRIRNRLTPRKATSLRKSSSAFCRPHHHPNSRAELRGNSEWGKIMSARRMVLMTPRARRASAKHAARVRWARAKVKPAANSAA